MPERKCPHNSTTISRHFPIQTLCHIETTHVWCSHHHPTPTTTPRNDLPTSVRHHGLASLPIRVNPDPAPHNPQCFQHPAPPQTPSPTLPEHRNITLPTAMPQAATPPNHRVITQRQRPQPPMLRKRAILSHHGITFNMPHNGNVPYSYTTASTRTPKPQLRQQLEHPISRQHPILSHVHHGKGSIHLTTPTPPTHYLSSSPTMS